MKKSIILIVTAILLTVGFQVLANKSEANSVEKIKTWCQANYWYSDEAPKVCEDHVSHSSFRYSNTRHILMHYPNGNLYGEYLDAQLENNTAKVIEIEKRIKAEYNLPN